MICEFCGGKTTKKRVRKQHWLHGRLYIIENVEAEVCNECGERYFHAKTLDAIDRFLEGKHEVKENLHVEVVSL
jgi:YgiT-type zinc finger domain-containing protein